MAAAAARAEFVFGVDDCEPRLFQLRLFSGEVDQRARLLTRAGQQVKEIAIVLRTGLRQQRRRSHERDFGFSRDCRELFIGAGAQAANDREQLAVFDDASSYSRRSQPRQRRRRSFPAQCDDCRFRPCR